MSPGTSESPRDVVRSGGFWSQALLRPRRARGAERVVSGSSLHMLGPAVAAFFHKVTQSGGLQVPRPARRWSHLTFNAAKGGPGPAHAIHAPHGSAHG